MSTFPESVPQEVINKHMYIKANFVSANRGVIFINFALNSGQKYRIEAALDPIYKKIPPMKKIILLGMIMTSSFALLAQDESTVHFGLKAAPSFAWLKTDSKDYTANGSKFGFSYGLMTEFNFTKRYAFATGIDVAYRGGKLKSIFNIPNINGGDSAVFTSEQAMILQYVEIPLTLKLKTNEIGYLTYFLQVGVSPGVNIRAKADSKTTLQANGVTTSASEDGIDIKDDINSFNLSMIIGGGVEYTLSGSTTLLVGVQFNNGFMDVADGDDLKANSNYLALTVGILF